MKIQVLAFGITKDLLNTSSLEIEIPMDSSVEKFKDILQQQYPKLTKISSFAVAVNEEYVANNVILKDKDILALIPPVSGG